MMLRFVVKQDHARFVERFRDRMEAADARLIEIVTYEDLVSGRPLSLGTYVFTSLGVLPQYQRAVAISAADALRESACPILNHPAQSLGRYDMLVKLHRVGLNNFRPYRCDESLDAIRYPVFVRESRSHNGSLSRLIESRAELETTLGSLASYGHELDHLIVVEFADTSGGSGMYHKYSAFRVGDAILPRYADFSTRWMIKRNDEHSSALILADGGERFVEAEAAYVDQNPHEDWLREAFDAAGYQYGRMDYGLVDGKPQVWEINTSPTFGAGVGHLHPLRGPVVVQRRPTAKRFYARFFAALVDLANQSGDQDSARSVSLELDPDLLKRARDEIRRERMAAVASRITKLGASWLRSPVFDGFKRRLRPKMLKASRRVR